MLTVDLAPAVARIPAAYRQVPHNPAARIQPMYIQPMYIQAVCIRAAHIPAAHSQVVHTQPVCSRAVYIRVVHNLVARNQVVMYLASPPSNRLASNQALWHWRVRDRLALRSSGSRRASALPGRWRRKWRRRTRVARSKRR